MPFVDNAYNGRVLLQGIMPFKITITAACDVGDLIGYDAITGGSAAWELAAASGKIPAQLVAGEQNKSSAATEITCFKMALIDFGSGSTATPGDVVYLSDTAGSYAATPGGWVHQAVGQCVSATEAFIQPDSSPVTAFSTTGTGFALHARAELASGKTSRTHFGGARIESKVIDGSTLTSDLYGIYVLVQDQETDNEGVGSVLRLEETSSANCGCEAFIAMHGGGGDSPDYTFLFHPQAGTSDCWDREGAAKTGAGGYIRIKMGTETQYINTYTA